jgi:predicted nucleotidyltransferase
MDPRVRAHILGMIKQYFPGSIGAFVLGSITTKRYTRFSDVDVNVVMPKRVDLGPYRSIAKAINKSKPRFQGSPHVITFFVVHPSSEKDAIQKTTGAYDLISNKWLKTPDDIGADPDEMEGAFQGQIKDVDIALGELNRDMRDINLIIEAFKEAPDSEKQKILIDLEEKKEEIEDDLKVLTEEYDEFHRARVSSFEKELSSDGPNAAKKHLFNQTLPGNVVFKMMERYGYRDLLERLRDIYKSMPGSASQS